MKNNSKRLLLILIPVIAIILLVLRLTGLIGIWTEGMAYIANNTEEFTDTKGHFVEGTYQFQLICQT